MGNGRWMKVPRYAVSLAAVFFPLQKTVSTKNFPRDLTSCINCIIISNTIVQSHKEENFSETVKNSLRLFRNILEK